MNTFVLFSLEHLVAIAVLFICLLILFMVRNVLARPFNHTLLFERLFALSLLAMEISYHLVLILEGIWSLSESLPLHLCSISLFCSCFLLWTGSKRLYDFIFFAGMGGALQAVLTPSIIVNFPDFKFIQFFYVHIGIILTAFYILWVKSYQPTFKSVIKTMVVLNIIFPFIFVLNILIQGNYMFLREKPINGSLLDFLGPFPWYIVSLEIVAFSIFVVVWLIFRKWKTPPKVF
ncbi:TIGR02206 family membrane protein [Psychrobacillus soli]|uniref:TIGR02206 family membrane protein n=2 Tax=Psychrobacillus soli TaxID=1543965 RepID=A0A544T9I2_9BACI|nr:TIGR02206 family membrane protein [Psychrobacillus soli]